MEKMEYININIILFFKVYKSFHFFPICIAKNWDNKEWEIDTSVPYKCTNYGDGISYH